LVFDETKTSSLPSGMKLFSLPVIVDKFQKKTSNKLQNIVSSATTFINDKKMKENYK